MQLEKKKEKERKKEILEHEPWLFDTNDSSLYEKGPGPPL